MPRDHGRPLRDRMPSSFALRATSAIVGRSQSGALRARRCRASRASASPGSEPNGFTPSQRPVSARLRSRAARQAVAALDDDDGGADLAEGVEQLAEGGAILAGGRAADDVRELPHEFQAVPLRELLNGAALPFDAVAVDLSATTHAQVCHRRLPSLPWAEGVPSFFGLPWE